MKFKNTPIQHCLGLISKIPMLSTVYREKFEKSGFLRIFRKKIEKNKIIMYVHLKKFLVGRKLPSGKRASRWEGIFIVGRELPIGKRASQDPVGRELPCRKRAFR